MNNAPAALLDKCSLLLIRFLTDKGYLLPVSTLVLSIPFIGVLKIICDRIAELKPWGKLLGDETPTQRKEDGGWNLERVRKKNPLSEKIVT